MLGLRQHLDIESAQSDSELRRVRCLCRPSLRVALQGAAAGREPELGSVLLQVWRRPFFFSPGSDGSGITTWVA